MKRKKGDPPADVSSPPTDPPAQSGEGEPVGLVGDAAVDVVDARASLGERASPLPKRLAVTSFHIEDPEEEGVASQTHGRSGREAVARNLYSEWAERADDGKGAAGAAQREGVQGGGAPEDDVPAGPDGDAEIEGFQFESHEHDSPTVISPGSFRSYSQRATGDADEPPHEGPRVADSKMFSKERRAAAFSARTSALQRMDALHSDAAAADLIRRHNMSVGRRGAPGCGTWAAAGRKGWGRGHWAFWEHAIEDVESHVGSSVASGFRLLRVVMLLNVAVAAIWLVLVVVPFFLDTPDTFSWAEFGKAGAADLLQANGLEDTFVLYSGYNQPPGEQHGFYRTGVAYSIAIAASYLCSILGLLLVVASRAAGAGDHEIVNVHRIYPFSSLALASWDHRITAKGAAGRAQKSLRTHLVELVGDVMLEEEEGSEEARMARRRWKWFGILVLSPLVMTLTGYLIWRIVTDRTYLTNSIGGFGYAETMALAAVNILGELLVRLLVKVERWPRRQQELAAAVKLFFLRFMNIVVLVYNLYDIETEGGGEGGECKEAIMGVIFIRILVTNIVVQTAGELIIHSASRRLCGIAQPFHVSIMVVDLLAEQALVWIGTTFVPILPFLAVASNAFCFYCKRYQVKHVSSVESAAHSASRTTNVMYLLLLAALVMCGVPLSFALFRARSDCGPHVGGSMASVLSEWINDGPSALVNIVHWLTNPMVLYGGILLLAAFVAVARGHVAKHRRERRLLKDELDAYRREMRKKMAKMRSDLDAAAEEWDDFAADGGDLEGGGAGGAGGLSHRRSNPRGGHGSENSTADYRAERDSIHTDDGNTWRRSARTSGRDSHGGGSGKGDLGTTREKKSLMVQLGEALREVALESVG